MKIIKLINKIEEILMYIGTALFILLIVVVFTQVILRYAFSTSFLWGEETGRFAFILFTYIGLVSCMRHNSSLRVDFLLSKFYGTKKKVLNMITMLISLAFCLFIAYWGYDTAMLVKDSNQIALTIPIPLVFIWGAIPLAFALSGIYTTLNIIKLFISEENDIDNR